MPVYGLRILYIQTRVERAETGRNLTGLCVVCTILKHIISIIFLYTGQPSHYRRANEFRNNLLQSITRIETHVITRHNIGYNIIYLINRSPEFESYHYVATLV